MLLLALQFDDRLLSYLLASSSLIGFLLVNLNSTHRLGSIRRSKLLQLLDELLASALRHPFPLSLGLPLHLWNHLDMLLLALQFDDRLLSYLLASSSLIGFLLVNLNSILVLVSTDHSMPLLGLDELSVLTLRHPYLPSLELQLLPWNHLDMLLLTRRFDGQLLSYPLASSSLIEYLLVNLNSTHRLGSIRHSTLLQSLDELLVSWLRRPYPPSLELQLHPWNHLDMLLLTLQFGGRLLLYPLASSNLIGYPLVDLYSTHQLASIRHSTLLQLLDELSVSWLRRPYLLSLELPLRLLSRPDMLLLALQFGGQLLSYPQVSSSLTQYFLATLNSTHRLGSVRHSRLLQPLDELLASWLRHLFPLSLELQLHLWNHLDMLLLALQFDDRLLSYLLASSSLIGFLLVNLNSTHRLDSNFHLKLLQPLDELSVSWLQRLYLLSLGLSLRLWSHLGTLLLALQFGGRLLLYLLVSSNLIGYLLVKLQLESIHRLALASRLMKHLILP